MENQNLLLNEAITYLKNYLFELCYDHSIMVTFHDHIFNKKLEDQHKFCFGEFVHYPKNNINEIKLLNYYENKLRELFAFSHELGHYFAFINFKNLSEIEEELYANKIFLDFLNLMPEWIIMALQSFVYEYGILEQEFNQTAIYMDLFKVKFENIERSYQENKKIGV